MIVPFEILKILKYIYMKENKDKECETGSSKKQNLNVEAMKPHLTDDTSLILQDQCNAEKG